ncbi:MAG: DUF4411 family protein [Chloroflexi bacterium]|nr:DUF4411 family protein [Chloroflexota bacterium]
MLYLLDASVLIDAKNKYYPLDRIPQFWNWLVHQSLAGNIKLPPQVIGEILGPDTTDEEPVDALAEWVISNRTTLEWNDELSLELLTRTYSQGYDSIPEEFTTVDPLSEPADPFLIAYALECPESRRVVTMESLQSVGTTLPKPANRRIPLVCGLLGVECINTFTLIRELDFRIPLAPRPGDTNANS